MKRSNSGNDSNDNGKDLPSDCEPPATGNQTSSSLMAGITRSTLLSVKQLGITGSYLGFQLRKRTFLFLGQRQQVLSEHLSSVSYPNGQPVLSKRHAKASYMIKNSILGVAVFGTYDLIVGWWTNKHEEQSSNQSTISRSALPAPDGLTEVLLKASVRPDDTQLLTPIYIHFGAGALAGMVQSFIMDIWDIGTFWWHHELNHNSTRQEVAKVNKGINTQFIVRRCIHHSLGYATLFGSFEFSRRFVLSSSYDYLRSGDPSVHNVLTKLKEWMIVSIDESDGAYDMTALPMMAAFLAGGVAGTSQHVVNHYTTNWKLLAHHEHQSNTNVWNRPPSFRGLGSSFLPAALTFVAFHYGGELAKRIMQDSEPDPFPIFIRQPPST